MFISVEVNFKPSSTQNVPSLLSLFPSLSLSFPFKRMLLRQCISKQQTYWMNDNGLQALFNIQQCSQCRNSKAWLTVYKICWKSPPLSLCLSLCHFESKILFANFHIICGIFLRKNTLLTSWFVSVSSCMIWWNQPLYNWTFSICIQHEMWCVLEIQPQLMFSATEIMQCFVAEYKMKCGYNVDNSIISASQTEWNLPK